MIDQRPIFEIHRLAHAGLSGRKIAKTLGISRQTTSTYLDDPTVPPWLIGTSLTVKADHHHLTCSCKDKAVATHLRCWQRTQRIELPQHREAAHKHHRRQWYSQYATPDLLVCDESLNLALFVGA